MSDFCWNAHFHDWLAMRSLFKRRTLHVERLEGRELLAADYLEAIGWTDLKTLLGPDMPTGAGVPVAQIEHREQNVSGYLPDPVDASFTGKSLAIQSGASINSRHATRVGEHFYGLDAGLAPGITDVELWEMDDWQTRLLNTGTILPPAVDSQKIQNHSWNGSGGLTDLERLRRFDYMIARDSLFAAVTIGNQGSMNVPRLLSSSYNAMTVGLTNGTANWGPTSFEGSGRFKPDIVAPESHTSQASPQVAGAAALLVDAASRTDWSAADKTAGQDSETLKAILMAGATKGQFPTWSRTETQPVDLHYGSGQLNVFNSYQILTAGKQDPGVVPIQGWDYGASTTQVDGKRYSFSIPAGTTLGEFSVALTWNREITSGSATDFSNLQSSVANLDLNLQRATEDGLQSVQLSSSTVGNVEYLYLQDLAAGDYQLSVTSNQADVSYALAWNGQAAETNTSIQASVSQTVYGQPIILTATVASDAASEVGQPTGSVTFFDGNVLLGMETLSRAGGVNRASLTITSLSAGNHSLRAAYVGQGEFVTSESATVSVAVQQAETTTTLQSSLSTSTPGQSVRFTATVQPNAPGAGAPTGSVTFRDGSTVLGTVAVAPVAGKYQAALDTASLSPGAHNITATYVGDGNFEESTSTSLIHSVGQAATTTTLTSNSPTRGYGEQVTLTATIQSAATGTISGTVTFKDGTKLLGTAQVSGGQASLAVSNLTVGAHSITAEFSGGSSFLASVSSPYSQTITNAATVMSLISDAGTAYAGEAVTFTATVGSQSGSATPVGNVTFKNGTKVLGTVPLDRGKAVLSTSSLPVGNLSITATYAGSANFSGSTATMLPVAIVKAPTATTVAAAPQSASYGTPLTLTATVTSAAGSAFPTGTLTFKDGTKLLGSASLVGGQATLTVSNLPVGTRLIKVTYPGNSTLASSTSNLLAVSITKASTVTTLSSSSPSVGIGQPVTFTASVTPGNGTSAIPTGTVTFKSGTTVLGTASLVNGAATLTLSTLSAGTHSITATYGATASYLSSKSDVLFQPVTAALSAGGRTSMARRINGRLA